MYKKGKVTRISGEMLWELPYKSLNIHPIKEMCISAFVTGNLVPWLNAAQSGNQGEGRDQEDDQAEDGKTI